MLARELEDRGARLDPFGRLTGLLLDLGDRHPLAQAHTEGVVARERRHARRDEVADPGEACEGPGVGAEGDPEPGHLGQPARDDRGLRVVAQTHALGHADGERDDVLDRTTDLGADEVGRGVRAEVARRRGRSDPVGRALVRARDDRGRRLALDDLLGEVRAGDDRDPLGRHSPGLGDDLTHPLRRPELDTLHERDDDPVPEDVAPAGEVVAQRLARHGEDDDVGPVDRLQRVGRPRDRGGQLVVGQVVRVAAGADLVGELLATRPDRHVVARVGEDRAEGRPPATAAEDCNLAHR